MFCFSYSCFIFIYCLFCFLMLHSINCVQRPRLHRACFIVLFSHSGTSGFGLIFSWQTWSGPCRACALASFFSSDSVQTIPGQWMFDKINESVFQYANYEAFSPISFGDFNYFKVHTFWLFQTVIKTPLNNHKFIKELEKIAFM